MASQNDEVFRSFRSNEIYKAVVETVREEDGINYFKIACSRSAMVKQSVKYFLNSDKVGKPELIDVKTGLLSRNYKISPTTARYIKNLSDLIFLFGDLSGLKIAEIGGGYAHEGCMSEEQLKEYETALCDDENEETDEELDSINKDDDVNNQDKESEEEESIKRGWFNWGKEEAHRKTS